MPSDWNRGLQPSKLELQEAAALTELQGLSQSEKLARGLDQLLEACRHQQRHAGPVTSAIIALIEALRGMVE